MLRKLGDLAQRLLGIRFIFVLPLDEGWEQISPGGKPEIPRFCRLIQSSKEGADRCRTNHLLMAVAGCSRGMTEQRCHAGASVVVTSVLPASGERLAVLSSCSFASPADPTEWGRILEHGRDLGIPTDDLRESYRELPALTPEKIETVRAIMAMAGDAVTEIRARLSAESALEGHPRAHDAGATPLERGIRENLSVSPKGGRSADPPGGKKAPILVDVVAELVVSDPGRPYSVGEIAAAARMTPNHFSTLFRIHKGSGFLEFLTDARIDRAKRLLRDLTKNIAEVSEASGFDDPSYFSRRFKERTGKTPTEWRNSLRAEPAPRRHRR